MNDQRTNPVYYFSENSVVQGPFRLDELITKIGPDTLVFIENGIKWLTAKEVPEIMNAINASKRPPEPEKEPEIQPEIKHEAGPLQETNVPNFTQRSDIADNPIPTNDHQNQTLPKEQVQESKAGGSDQNTVSFNQNKSKSSNVAVTIVSILLLVFTGLGLFYFFWLAPFLKDKNAPRKYCYIGSLVVRSSKVMGVEYNVIGTCTYGEELIAYEDDGTWTTCKYNGKECYVASRYLLGKEDFHTLHSIFSDADSRDAVPTAKCRIALLEYYKRNRFIGIMDQASQMEIFGQALNYPAWELKARNKDIKPNTVIYPRVVNANSKFTDFGCIIRNVSTGKRKFLLFSFADDESPTLQIEQDAPDSGYVYNISKYPNSDGYYSYYINYSF